MCVWGGRGAGRGGCVCASVYKLLCVIVLRSGFLVHWRTLLVVGDQRFADSLPNCCIGKEQHKIIALFTGKKKKKKH